MSRLHVQSSTKSAQQSAAIARIGASWANVQFTRSKAHSKGYTLLNLPPQHFEAICARLFLHGCQLQACGQVIPEGQLWITFSGSRHIIAKFAQLFPCPVGADPLVVSASGDRVLSGAAVKAALRKLRAQQAQQPLMS